MIAYKETTGNPVIMSSYYNALSKHPVSRARARSLFSAPNDREAAFVATTSVSTETNRSRERILRRIRTEEQNNGLPWLPEEGEAATKLAELDLKELAEKPRQA